MKFTAWEARRHIENKYKTALRKLGRFLTDMINDEESAEAVADSFSQYSQSKQFNDWAESLAHTFVTNTLEENARTWQQAAKMSGQGNDIRKGLYNEMQGPVGVRYRELIDSNAQYIKSIPEDAAQRLVRHVSKEAQRGSRTAYNTDEFKDYVGDITNWHAKVISRTETSKANSALTQARAEYTGHDWYIWHTSEDQRVRKSHAHMDEVMCRFTDKPSPEKLVSETSVGHYGPGEIFNCRCFAEPIIAWDEIQWPMKVYANGSITRMSKKQFEEQFGQIDED